MKDFDLKHFLSTESELLAWKTEGLPFDDLSLENGLVILQVFFVQNPNSRDLHAIMILVEFSLSFPD